MCVYRQYVAMSYIALAQQAWIYGDITDSLGTVGTLGTVLSIKNSIRGLQLFFATFFLLHNVAYLAFFIYNVTEQPLAEVKILAKIDIVLRFPSKKATVWNGEVYKVYSSIIICVGIFSYTLFIYQIFYH